MRPEPTLTIEVITPTKAKAMLAKNPTNRALRSHRVRQYADQMSRNQWEMVGDPIRFDTNGNLLDGQHRLAAVVSSGKSMKFVIVRGLPSESFVVMDSGMNRSTADGLGREVKAATHKAAAIRLLWIVECDGDPRKSEERLLVTRTDIHEYYEANSEKIDEATLAGSMVYNAAGGNRSAWIAFYVLADRIDSAARHDFMESMRTGAGLTGSDARLSLRNWLLQSRNKRVTASGDHLALYIKAWNDWRSGRSRSVMRLVSNDEAFPTIK